MRVGPEANPGRASVTRKILSAVGSRAERVTERLNIR